MTFRGVNVDAKRKQSPWGITMGHQCNWGVFGVMRTLLLQWGVFGVIDESLVRWGRA